MTGIPPTREPHPAMACPSTLVAQLGARRHYAVPAAFARRGRLAHLFTDIYPRPETAALLARLPSRTAAEAAGRLAGRRHPDIAPTRVTGFPFLAIAYAVRRRFRSEPRQRSTTFAWVARAFNARILRRGFGEAEAVYGFSTAALELLAAARAAGRFTILDQTIVPARVRREIMAREFERFADWEAAPPWSAAEEHLAAREEREWRHADLILCGSPFVRDGVAAAGGPAGRCAVVPYGVARPKRAARQDVTGHRGPLRVLFIGAVGLRKGAPYLLEAARLLGRAVDVRMVGPVQVSARAARRLSAAVELAGAVPRGEVARHLDWADVMVLPTLCEGSAVAVCEALAAGVPVITTPNAGSAVRDGNNGFLVPIRDGEAIADRLLRLDDDRALLAALRRGAAASAEETSLERYHARLIAAVAAAFTRGR